MPHRTTFCMPIPIERPPCTVPRVQAARKIIATLGRWMYRIDSNASEKSEVTRVTCCALAGHNRTHREPAPPARGSGKAAKVVSKSSNLFCSVLELDPTPPTPLFQGALTKQNLHQNQYSTFDPSNKSESRNLARRATVRPTPRQTHALSNKHKRLIAQVVQ